MQASSNARPRDLDTPQASPSPKLLDLLIREHHEIELPRLQRLWRYYKNNRTAAGLAQAEELPDRLRRNADSDASGREIVIENDIGWRIDTLVEFVVGSGPTLHSQAESKEQRQRIEGFLADLFHDAGGVSFYHNLLLLGSVYGFVDVLVHMDRAGSRVSLETIEPTRFIPLMNPVDYQQLDAAIIHFPKQSNEVTEPGFVQRVRGKLTRNGLPSSRAVEWHTHVWTPDRFDHLVSQQQLSGLSHKQISTATNVLGRIPIVHIQNTEQPFQFAGLSDVEPLIPLQNELNTRLSDRANRITFQAFKMYLGIGIEGFIDRPIGPGQMWSTDNPDARIEAFGGDASTPSEDAHIKEVREAMDKTSSVTPVAAGIIGGRVGNLTSENALRVVLMSLLAKTRRKRSTYGRGIQVICEQALHAADMLGLLKTSEEDRRVRIDWPNPAPAAETQQLKDALIKKELGVPSRHILAELGYAGCEDPSENAT